MRDAHPVGSDHARVQVPYIPNAHIVVSNTSYMPQNDVGHEAAAALVGSNCMSPGSISEAVFKAAQTGDLKHPVDCYGSMETPIGISHLVPTATEYLWQTHGFPHEKMKNARQGLSKV